MQLFNTPGRHLVTHPGITASPLVLGRVHGQILIQFNFRFPLR